jgi:hypothetical protein
MGTAKEEKTGDEIAERRDAALLRALNTPHSERKRSWGKTKKREEARPKDGASSKALQASALP